MSRLGMLAAFDPRVNYLRGLGTFNPRKRYLHGLGCVSCTRMISPLGQDIEAPDIGPSAPPDISLPSGIVSAPSGPASPYGTFSTTETAPGTTLTPPIFAQSSAQPIAPAFSAAMPTAPMIMGAAPGSVALPGGILAPSQAMALTSAPGTILGVPSQYIMYAGLAIVGLAAISGMGGKKRR